MVKIYQDQSSLETLLKVSTGSVLLPLLTTTPFSNPKKSNAFEALFVYIILLILEMEFPVTKGTIPRVPPCSL